MYVFRAESTNIGGVRMHSFDSRRDRDEFVAADPEHRRKLTYEKHINRIRRYNRPDKYRDVVAWDGHINGKTPSRGRGSR